MRSIQKQKQKYSSCPLGRATKKESLPKCFEDHHQLSLLSCSFVVFPSWAYMNMVLVRIAAAVAALLRVQTYNPVPTKNSHWYYLQQRETCRQHYQKKKKKRARDNAGVLLTFLSRPNMKNILSTCRCEHIWQVDNKKWPRRESNQGPWDLKGPKHILAHFSLTEGTARVRPRRPRRSRGRGAR